MPSTTGALKAIDDSQLSGETPCENWNVADLIAHVVRAPVNFTTMVEGEQPDWSAPDAPVGSDWAAAFRSNANDLIHAWQEAGDAASPGDVDFQTAEFAIHTWDLVRATGQSTDLDPEVARRGLEFLAAALNPENRGEAFQAEVPMPEDAPVYDRLAAFAGRDPR